MISDDPRPAAAANWHPLDMLPAFRRWPRGPWLDVGYTAVFSLGFGFVVLAVALLNDPTILGWEALRRVVVDSLCIGGCAHALHLLRSRLVPETAPRSWRLGASVVVTAVAVFAGFALATALQNHGAAGLSMLMAGRFPVVLASFAVAVSVVLLFALLASERRAAREAELTRARDRHAVAERAALAAHLRLLQAQIEPHFLYNTLANAVAQIDAAPADARRLLEHLIDYLRAALQASRAEVHTLGRELALLEAYLSLMALRLGTRLRWRIELPDELAGFAVAPMLVQPLVENAVSHGIEPAVDGGEIVVSAHREADGRVAIEVSDTGVGINPHAPRRPGGGVGLSNVRERLRALHGEAASLRLDDREGGGTLARLILPSSS